jgi:hypothetical protein
VPADVREATSATALTVDVDRLRRQLAGDLDNIVLKALSKEPQRRYASVDQFSEDVRRHLAGLPVLARKDTWGYRTTKFVRRNRAIVGAGVVTFAVLVAGVIATTWQARVARAERARAEQRFGDVRQLAHAFLFDFHDSIADLEGSTPARKLVVTKGLEYLDRLARDAGDRVDLRREIAAAYVKVGDVQGRPFTPNLGDTAGALASYRKAIGLYESIAGDAGARRSAAARSGARLRASQRRARGGRQDGRVAVVRAEGPGHRARVSSDRDRSPEARRALVASYTRVGDMLAATGKVTAALEHRRTAWRSWNRSRPPRPRTSPTSASSASPTRSSATPGQPQRPERRRPRRRARRPRAIRGDLPQRLGAVPEATRCFAATRRRREQRRRRPGRDEARRRGAGPGDGAASRSTKRRRARIRQRRRAERSRDRLLEDGAAPRRDRPDRRGPRSQQRATDIHRRLVGRRSAAAAT